MYVENNSQIYGCFRCGAVMGEMEKEEDTAIYKCCECGEHSIVGFVQAMDMLNELYVNGELHLEPNEDEFDFGDVNE